MAQILDGLKVSKEIKEEIKNKTIRKIEVQEENK